MKFLFSFKIIELYLRLKCNLIFYQYYMQKKIEKT